MIMMMLMMMLLMMLMNADHILVSSSSSKLRDHFVFCVKIVLTSSIATKRETRNAKSAHANTRTKDVLGRMMKIAIKAVAAGLQGFLYSSFSAV